MPRVLIVDDEAIFRKVLTNLLAGRGYTTTAAESGEEALHILQEHSFDLMISDVSMEPMNGMELLCTVRELYPDMGVSMLTGHATIDTAVEAMKKGAFDYIVKPFKLDELFLTVERMLEYYTASTENKTLKARPEKLEPLEGLVAQSASMRNVCQLVERVAPTDIPVLICGESGTGKELVARSLHRYSPRKDGPFKTINCAELPARLIDMELFGCVKGTFDKASTATTAGLFETAQNGVITKKALPANIVATVGERVCTGTIPSRREQLKGKSFKALLLEKNKELLERASRRAKQPEAPPEKTPRNPDEGNNDFRR